MKQSPWGGGLSLLVAELGFKSQQSALRSHMLNQHILQRSLLISSWVWSVSIVYFPLS